MSYLIQCDQLETRGPNRYFSGQRYGTDVSFILVDMPPGASAKLHVHSYEEVFIVLEGTAAYTLIEDGRAIGLDVEAGQIIVVPAGVPHKFVNTGDGPLRQVDIHVSPEFGREWLED